MSRYYSGPVSDHFNGERIAAESYDWYDRVEIGRDTAVTLVPTRHWSARSLSDRNMSLWASFVIEAPAGRVYFVGDSRGRMILPVDVFGKSGTIATARGTL